MGVSPARVVLVQPKRKWRFSFRCASAILFEREGGELLPALEVKILPVELQGEFHGSWVGLDISDPPEGATRLVD